MVALDNADPGAVVWLIEVFSKLHESIKYDNNPVDLIEISVLKWCKT